MGGCGDGVGVGTGRGTYEPPFSGVIVGRGVALGRGLSLGVSTVITSPTEWAFGKKSNFTGKSKKLLFIAKDAKIVYKTRLL